jgi:hypothetical protein
MNMSWLSILTQIFNLIYKNGGQIMAQGVFENRWWEGRGGMLVEGGGHRMSQRLILLWYDSRSLSQMSQKPLWLSINYSVLY